MVNLLIINYHVSNDAMDDSLGLKGNDRGWEGDMSRKHEEVIISQSAILPGIHQFGEGKTVASGV